MKLKKLDIKVVSVPLKRPIIARVGSFNQWPLVLIDVHTENGFVGRSYLEPYVQKLVPSIVEILKVFDERFKNREIAPLDVYKESMSFLHLNGKQGTTLIALSGIDMAIWDALAKETNVPLVTLLGGTPGEVRAYNTNGLWLSPLNEIAREVRELVAQGDFKAVKLRLGREKVEEDKEAIKIIRSEVGDNIKIMTDFNQGYSFAEAQMRMISLDEEGLYWFEEPIAYDDLEGNSRLLNKIKTPLQIGENLYGPREVMRSIRANSSDLLMPDLMRIGGVSGWIRSAAIAAAAGVPLSSHLYTDLSAQLLRVSESCDWLEWSDWASPILKNPLEVKNGIAETPNVVGNGIEWNTKAVEKYSI